MDRGGGSRLNARPDSTHSPTVSPQQIFPPASSGGLRNDPRNVWVARRIKDAIGEAAQNLINVDAFIRTSVVERRLQEFYSASGPPRIIFFLQQAPVTPFGDLDEETELKLIPTDGLDTQLRGKCIYFIRQAPIVDPDTKTPDLDMFYGEVNTDVLESFHLTLSGAFLPLLEGGMQDWGRSTDASTKEYLSAVTRFDEMIADAVSSLQVRCQRQRERETERAREAQTN